MELTERQERVLRTIIDLYISSAHPVGSAAVVASSGLHVSSATVRHELSVLEERGLVRQLHTSGGRVPTNEGYRYYVERLMEPARLSNTDARTIRHQFHQAPTELQEWLKLAATVMAHRMRNVGLVTAPKSSEFRLRHLEVISIQSTVALLIVVLQEGTILQEMLTLPEERNQEELSALADRLSRLLRGQTASHIESKVEELPSLDASIAAVAAHLLRRGEEQHAPVFHAGLADLLQQPEFALHQPGEQASVQHERLRHMVEFLQQGFAVDRLLSGLPEKARVQVMIGSDAPAEGLQDYSFVLGRYGEESDGSGYVGIVGPTRLEYHRAVALVSYMTDLMTDLMQAY